MAAAGNVYRHEYEVVDDGLVWDTIPTRIGMLAYCIGHRTQSTRKADRLKKTGDDMVRCSDVILRVRAESPASMIRIRCAERNTHKEV